jgi:DNA-binding Xre family transcriptional regulator
MALNVRFGDLLSEGISSAARRQQKKIQGVEYEIGNALEVSVYSVQRWRRGYIPTKLEQVAFLVRYCVTHGRVDKSWASSILIQARYSDSQALLQQLFPASPQSQDQTKLDLLPRIAPSENHRIETQSAFKKTFAETLEELREARHISKKNLAKRAGLSAAYISLLTKGYRRTPSKETIAALAQALELDPEAASLLSKATEAGTVISAGESL